MRGDYGHLYEFGPFRLDAAEGQLLREGQPVPLAPKVFETLVVLVERSGHLVGKEELIRALWPDSFVEEANLTTNVWTLRKALGESHHSHKYIETVPKKGYRFVAGVRVVGCEEEIEVVAENRTVTRIVTEVEEETSSGTVAVSALAPVGDHAAPLVSQSSGSTEQLAARHFTPRVRIAWLLLSVGALTVGTILGLRALLRPGDSADETRRVFQAMQVNRFTASGNIVIAAISPDAKYVATVINEGGLQSLWVHQVAANTSSVRLITPAPVDYWGLTFSNDSNFIYFVSWVRNESDAGLYATPVLGGTARKLPTTIDTPISFSPSGDRFAYVFSSSSKGESYLKVANIDGGGVQILSTRRKPGFFAAYPGGPSWSPDGKLIACAADSSPEGDGQHMSVFVTNSQSGQERQLSERSWIEVGRVSWLADGSGLMVSAREQIDDPRQLWFISYPEGTARRITNDLHDYDSASLTADAKTLGAIQTQEAFTISVTPYVSGNQVPRNSPGASVIFSQVGSGRERVSWAPNNRVVYSSRASGNWDLWSMNKNGSEQKQLTFDLHNDLFPAVSRDGRYIFFASDRAGAFNIWRMEIDGNHQTQLTHGLNQTLPEVTADGQWVVYQQGLGPDEPSVWRVPASGGESDRLTNSLTLRPVTSPDGQRLAYVYLDEKGWGLAVRWLNGNEGSEKFPFPNTVASRFFRWTPDGRSLAYIANEKGASNVWAQSLDGTAPRRLTNFTSGQLLSFAWSPDGQWLAFVNRTATSDVVLISDFK